MSKKSCPVPGTADLIAYLNANGGKVGKKEIARAFHLRGEERVKLKKALKELKESGRIETYSGKKMITADGLPERCVCEITGTDSDGELIARPLKWDKPEPAPQILITDLGRLRPPPSEGDYVVLRLTPAGKRFFHGEVLRRVSDTPNRLVALFEKTGKTGGRLTAVDRRIRQSFFTDSASVKASDGDVVIAEIQGSALRGQPSKAKIVRVVGKATDPHAASLIAIALHGIPTDFTEDALRQAKKAKLPSVEGRTDLRDLPLVTIDGEDARDFDDAIYAEPADDGWKIVVAIADVAYFVRPDDPIDLCARERGNSVYFPDRCVPMLPPELSTDLCSLKPERDRPCLAVRLTVGKNGKLEKYKFVRAVMRSAARLNYHEVQDVFDGKETPINDGLRQALKNIYGAYKALETARKKRGALELDVTEREITLDKDGKIADIRPRERLDSHKAVEEFMIAANVAAARCLEEHHTPVMYRVHEPPSPEKAMSLKTTLTALGLKAPKPDHAGLNKVLESVRGTTKSYAVNQLVLRSQSQARYSPENAGHFGLALDTYAHFTSPIRRYADLLVHRGLISALRFGGEGLIAPDGSETCDLETTGEHISATERRAAAAERDAEDRYLSAYLKDRVGERFTGVVSGLNRFGLFVTLEDLGAEGLIPVNTLPNDYYIYDEERFRLVGADAGNTYELGEKVEMILSESVPVTGGLIFHLLDAGRTKPAGKKAVKKSRPVRKRK